MKASRLKMYLQQFINNIVIEKLECDEVELGFDAMLSHDVVNFLTTDHNIIKPLAQRIVFKQEVVFALDEHELAMV
jgi:hypothetical protein